MAAVDDPRPDELLEQAGRLLWQINAAVCWTDGLANDAEAKSCSRGGQAAWKAARPLREQLGTADAAAGFFKERARKRNPAVTAVASGFDLVEYDGDRDELDRKHGIPRLPETFGWQSRRGPHMAFTAPPKQAPVKIQIDESGVTVSSDGYLVCPPAWRKEHGVVYELNGTRELAMLPDDLRELLLARGAETRAETRRRFAEGEEIPKGHRDVAIFWVAVDLLRSGLEREVALERALKAAREQCQPPLDPRLAQKQFRGAVKFVTEHPTETEKARAEARRVLNERRAGRERPDSDAEQPAAARARSPWEEPVPLISRPPVPSFPLDTLPNWLRSWAVETAAEKGASVDLAGTLALGVVAGALARHVQVSPRPGWWEPINLYLATALEPGQRKTPVFKAAFRPVRTLERKRIGEWEEQTRLITLSGAIFEKRRKELINEAASDEELDPDRLSERMEELLEGLGETEAPVRPRLLTEDVTPEGLAQLLAEHGRIIAASDEGVAIFENFSGRYTRGSTSWDLFNKAHSAADLVVDRKSSGPVIVWDPALTLVIATQPKALRDLWGKPGAEGRGVLARPLYSLPDSVYTTGRTPAASESVLATFETRVRALFEDVPLLPLDEEGKPQPLTLRLDPLAEAAFARYEEELAQERRRLGTSEEAEGEAAYLGWLSKLAGQTARLAACLHAAAHWTEGVTAETTIEVDQVESAIRLARYFQGHALVVFGLMGELPEQRRALTILGWLRARSSDELEQLTVRDVHRSRAKGTTTEQVRAALSLLEKHGYVRVERGSTSAKGGRPSERVHAHPAVASSSTDLTEPTEPGARDGSVGSVGHIEQGSPVPGEVEHRDRDCREKRRWLARDGVWRCRECEPPHWPGEVVEECKA
jgi:replicative DNA helicase